MTRFLMLTLYAPTSSWGDIAVGETRDTWDRPSRSAVLGLIAAAKGLERADQQAHEDLDASVGVAVRLDAPGRALDDYHTAQTAPSSVIRRLVNPTRKQALEAGKPETILSRRYYRTDALATAALWNKPNASVSLAEIEQALRQPAFVLFAGRKANALGLPLDPQCLEAPTLAQAFLARAPLPKQMAGELSGLKPRDGWGREVMMDPSPDMNSGLVVNRRVLRRDAQPHRVRWQFSERVVDVGYLPEGSA